jgi:hypothetical protein
MSWQNFVQALALVALLAVTVPRSAATSPRLRQP